MLLPGPGEMHLGNSPCAIKNGKESIVSLTTCNDLNRETVHRMIGSDFPFQLLPEGVVKMVIHFLRAPPGIEPDMGCHPCSAVV